MSSTGTNKTPYSTSDIQKYLEGELSAREMHELEKAALEDPFLADALDGIAFHEQLRQPVDGVPALPSFDEEMVLLHQRLAEKIAPGREKQPIPLPRPLFARRGMRIAAAIILLLGLGGTVYFIQFNGPWLSPVSVAARHLDQEPPAPPAPEAESTPPSTRAAGNKADSAGITSSPSAGAPPVANAPRSKTDRVADAPPAPVPAAASPALVERKAAVAPRHTQVSPVTKITPADSFRSLAASSEPAASRVARLSPPVLAVPPRVPVTLQKETISPSALPSRPPLSDSDAVADISANSEQKEKRISIRGVKKDTVEYNAAAFTKKPVLPTHSIPITFSGKVVDNEDKPLPGALLSLKGEKIAVTNDKGFFSLNLRPQDSAHQLTIAAIGYEQASLPLDELNTDETAGNIIRLRQQHSSLDEVVVTGYGALRKETRVEAPSPGLEKLDTFWQKAAPLIGIEAYRNYLETGKKLLKVDTTLKGSVIISFTVDRKGILSAFKVEQSLSPAHDAGLIHLITDGPPWKVVRGKNIRTVVSLTW